eukprot:TRINITY_DN32572_c0_g1_i1.p1 TRINITY_DN32572_c0_g1~~TRINITY_DN32572_c0_g1_i1.p1  ORF type:complete len:274 (+),score=25.02 TRINITY_DN32572_c0_g1_i1:60-881(+)
MAAEDWERNVDPATSREYWYNKVTQESTWENPTAKTAAPTGGDGSGLTGVVASWNDEKGFGFITPGDGTSDIFCHRSSIGGSGHLIVGAQVQYETPTADTRRPDRMISKRVWGEGVQLSANRGLQAGLMTGNVATWNDDKGFGFITPRDGGGDVFVHRSSFGGVGHLVPGQTVYFEPPQPDARRPERLITKQVSGPGVIAGEKGKGGGGQLALGYPAGYGVAPEGGYGQPYPAIAAPRTPSAGSWTKYADERTGLPYWHNGVTGESSWTNPHS